MLAQTFSRIFSVIAFALKDARRGSAQGTPGKEAEEEFQHECIIRKILGWSDELDAPVYDVTSWPPPPEQMKEADRLAYMRVQKTGSKSTVSRYIAGGAFDLCTCNGSGPIVRAGCKACSSHHLDLDRACSNQVLMMRIGFLWPSREQCTVRSCHDMTGPSSRFPDDLLPPSDPARTPRLCVLEGHCNMGFENFLRSRAEEDGSRLRMIVTIRDPVLRLLSQFRHTCGVSISYCSNSKKMKEIATQSITDAAKRAATKDGIAAAAGMRYPTFSTCPVPTTWGCNETSIWKAFMEFASDKRNSFPRSQLTQYIGAPKENAAGKNLGGAMISFGPSAGIPKEETELLKDFLARAKEAMSSKIETILLTDSVGTFGLSLNSAAHQFQVPLPPKYDVLYEPKERTLTFPPMPESVRKFVEPYMEGDLALWRHARGLVYTRTMKLVEGAVAKGRLASDVLADLNYTCHKQPNVHISGYGGYKSYTDHVCELSTASREVLEDPFACCIWRPDPADHATWSAINMAQPKPVPFSAS